jgi:hypothetical protein
MEKQQTPRKTTYDIYGALVDPYGEVQYVSTKVANAFRVARKYRDTTPNGTEQDFQKKNPETVRILQEWMSSHIIQEGVPLVENDDMANLILRY